MRFNRCKQVAILNFSGCIITYVWLTQPPGDLVCVFSRNGRTDKKSRLKCPKLQYVSSSLKRQFTVFIYYNSSLKRRSLARACRTREAPMRLEREAERVAANTPHVMSSGTALMYWEEGGGGQCTHSVLKGP